MSTHKQKKSRHPCTCVWSYLCGQLEGVASARHAHVGGFESAHHLADGLRVCLEDESQADVGRHDVFGGQVAVVNVANEVPHGATSTNTHICTYK